MRTSGVESILFWLVSFDDVKVLKTIKSKIDIGAHHPSFSISEESTLLKPGTDLLNSQLPAPLNLAFNPYLPDNCKMIVPESSTDPLKSQKGQVRFLLEVVFNYAKFGLKRNGYFVDFVVRFSFDYLGHFTD